MDHVTKSLTSLDTHKATGLDGLSSKLLKLSAPAIATPLTQLINQSITSGKFPTQWKTARITPIHKAGDHSETNNFRPISILCVTSKILERHIHNHFYQYLIDNNLLHPAQSGFRPKHSCETALAKLVNDWTENMEKGLLNGVIFVDLRKAFDLVDTNILLQKLELYKCDNTSLSWFRSYLQGRSQCVQFKSAMSKTAEVTHGVPQGSILGPLLFITFMNDLPFHIVSHIDMYADDSTVHVSAKTVCELNQKLNVDLENIKIWCRENNMLVNKEKTKAMLVTTYQRATHLDTQTLDVNYDGVALCNVDCEKLLGVNVDKHLSWREQVNKVANNLSKSIALLRRIKCYLPTETRLTYYKTFLQPHIDYCLLIWGQSNHICRIHKLQKMALRVIYDKPKITSSEPLFKQSGLLPVQKRYLLRTSITVYKAMHGLAPAYISAMFQQKNGRTTRSSTRGDLCIPSSNLCVTRKALPYSGANIYNSLPCHIRQSSTLNSFKTHAYKYFM